MYKLKLTDLDKALSLLNKEGGLYIPAVAGFVPYTEGAKPELTALPRQSIKELFFPQNEELLTFTCKGQELKLEQKQPRSIAKIVFGVKACDAHSLVILDKVFLEAPVDTYYAKGRQETILIGLGCSRPTETCFCHSLGLNGSRPATDVQTWLVGKELYWEPITSKGQEVTKALAGLLEQAEDTGPVAAQEQQLQAYLSKLPLGNFKANSKLAEQELQVFNSKAWEKLAAGCLSCCTCTYACPTCHCYDIRDCQVKEGTTVRYRCWDSCMARDFTKMAHGNPRKSKVERFRQRYMHKLVYFPANHQGLIACTGCGRCLQQCPAHLNIVKVAKALEVDLNV